MSGNAESRAERLADIRLRLEAHTQAGRYFWDCFTCEEVEFLLRQIDGSTSNEGGGSVGA